MRVEIIEKIKILLQEHPFTPANLNGAELYVYDDIGLKKTIFTDMLPEDFNYLKIKNTNHDEFISHICVDGDLIEHGQEKYNNYSLAYSDGRNDCILINDITFLFVEFKLEQLETTFDNEKRKWKTFKSGAEQIIDFFSYLKIIFEQNNDSLYNYIPKQSIKAVVCMRFEPDFNPRRRSNTQRNQQKELLAQRMDDIEIVPLNYQDPYIFYV